MDHAVRIRKAKTAHEVREAIGEGITPGEWKLACDSNGNDACVYVTLKLPGGEYLHKIASRIPNWKDGRLIEAAPDLMKAAKFLGGGDMFIEDYGRTCHCPCHARKGGVTREVMMDPKNHATVCNMMWDAIAKAEGR